METILEDRRCRFIAEKMEITNVMEYEEVPEAEATEDGVRLLCIGCRRPVDLVGEQKCIFQDPVSSDGLNPHRREQEDRHVNNCARLQDLNACNDCSSSMQKMAHPEGPCICVNTDVFKVLAHWAAGILIGRPVVFSLEADGEAGVRKVLRML